MDSSSIPIIAGVVGGIVALNLTLLVTWCIMRRRRAKQKLVVQKNAFSLPRHSLPQMSQATSPNYQQLFLEVHDTRRKSTFASEPPPSPRTRNVLSKHPKSEERDIVSEIKPNQAQQTLVALDTDLVRGKLRPPPLLSVSKPNLTAVPVNELSVALPATSLKRGLSVRSADSESIYSVASVAPELHDRVFQPWSLEPIPASPLSPSRGEAAQMLPPSHDRTLIREELAPETFDKWRFEDRQSSPVSPTHGRRISGSIPPVPPLSSYISNPISPISPLQLVTHHRSNSGSHYRPYAAPPSPVDDVLPKVPPRSPLRNVRSQWVGS